MNKKIKIAVTGSIGSGKSEFCKILEKKGFPVINVDKVSKELLISDKVIQQEIKKNFGNESYLSDGQINTKYLAEKVFSNPQNVLKINSIVHPRVKEKVKKIIKQKFEENDIVFAEAALIYEADMENMFDYVVLISADEKIRLERKIKYSNFTEQEFFKRNENQIRDEEKKKRADFTFMNNGSIDELKIKTELFIKIINGLAGLNV